MSVSDEGGPSVMKGCALVSFACSDIATLKRAGITTEQHKAIMGDTAITVRLDVDRLFIGEVLDGAVRAGECR